MNNLRMFKWLIEQFVGFISRVNGQIVSTAGENMDFLLMRIEDLFVNLSGKLIKMNYLYELLKPNSL